MATIKDVPLFKDSAAGLKKNIGEMLKSTFPDHKIYFSNQNITTPDEKYIVVKRTVRKGNTNGLNLVPTHFFTDPVASERTYTYMATVSFRIKFHKSSAIDDAFYLKMLLSTDDFHYKWWGTDLYGITNVSDVTDDPVVVDFVQWEEGAIFTFECNYIFKHVSGDTSYIDKVLFSVDNSSGKHDGETKEFWKDFGFDTYAEYAASKQ